MYSMRFLLWLQGHPTPPELTSDPVSQLHIRTPDQASLVAATKSATSRDGHDGATSLTKKNGLVLNWGDLGLEVEPPISKTMSQLGIMTPGKCSNHKPDFLGGKLDLHKSSGLECFAGSSVAT